MVSLIEAMPNHISFQSFAFRAVVIIIKCVKHKLDYTFLIDFISMPALCSSVGIHSNRNIEDLD